MGGGRGVFVDFLFGCFLFWLFWGVFCFVLLLLFVCFLVFFCLFVLVFFFVEPVKAIDDTKLHSLIPILTSVKVTEL